MGVDMMCPYKTCADLVWRNRLGQTSPHDPPRREWVNVWCKNNGIKLVQCNYVPKTTYPKRLRLLHELVPR